MYTRCPLENHISYIIHKHLSNNKHNSSERSKRSQGRNESSLLPKQVVLIKISFILGIIDLMGKIAEARSATHQSSNTETMS